MKVIPFLILLSFSSFANANQLFTGTEESETEAGTMCNSPKCQKRYRDGNCIVYTNNRRGVYSPTKKYKKEDYLLNWEEYPWGVCLEKSNLTDKEKEWTRHAIKNWNEGYKKYAKKRVNEIPQLKKQKLLFIETCQHQKNDTEDYGIKDHGIIDIEKGGLPNENETLFGYWQPSFKISFDGNCKWKVGIKGFIRVKRMSKVKTKQRFINIMTHELGHAIGIPHLPPWGLFEQENTQIMYGKQLVLFTPCNTKRQICKPKNADFNAFVKHHKFLNDADFDAFVKRHSPPSLNRKIIKTIKGAKKEAVKGLAKSKEVGEELVEELVTSIDEFLKSF